MCVNLPHIRPMALESLQVDEIGNLFARTSSQCRGKNCRILLVIRNSLLIMTFCFFAVVPASHACTCSNAAPGACPGLKTSDIVFLGTVTEAAFVRPTKPADAIDDATSGVTSSSGGTNGESSAPDANAPAAI